MSQQVSATLTGLATGTTYYFRVVAGDAAGTSLGVIAGFPTATGDAIQMGGSIQGTPLSLAGTTSTFSGGGSHGSVDGIGTAARFGYPRGITTDGANLFVADGHTIRKKELDKEFDRIRKELSVSITVRPIETLEL